MGMMDEKRYLTGNNGVVAEGDTFHLHAAVIAGMVNTPNGPKHEAALTISKSGTEDPITVHTTGAAIVGQVQRIDLGDRRRMESSGGWAVKLDTIDVGKGNRAFVLAPAGEEGSPDRTPAESSGF